MSPVDLFELQKRQKSVVQSRKFVIVLSRRPITSKGM
jgi:hypothetical protein